MIHVGCGGEVLWVDVTSVDEAWVCQRCGEEVDGEDMAAVVVHSAPMPDTGIGREAGFADDAALRAAVAAERVQWPEWQRLKVAEMQRDIERALILGPDAV